MRLLGQVPTEVLSSSFGLVEPLSEIRGRHELRDLSEQCKMELGSALHAWNKTELFKIVLIKQDEYAVIKEAKRLVKANAFAVDKSIRLPWDLVYFIAVILQYQFLLLSSMQPKGKLAAQLNSILQDLKSQNRQINSTLKSLKKVKSQETFRAKPSQSVIEHPNIDKITKNKKPIEVKVRKSKTFHRCQSCKFMGGSQIKQNCEKAKEKLKIIPKKVKTLSLLQIQRKSYLKLGKSPVRKSNVTTKYMAILDTKRTKKL